MIEYGADYADILLMKFLPMINWEMRYDDFEKIRAKITEGTDSEELTYKLDSMKEQNGMVVFDYMKSVRS